MKMTASTANPSQRGVTAVRSIALGVGRSLIRYSVNIIFGRLAIRGWFFIANVLVITRPHRQVRVDTLHLAIK